MFVLPGDTTPLSAKTFLGKVFGGDCAAWGKWLCCSPLSTHMTSLWKPKALFCSKMLDFSSASLAVSELDPGQIFPVQS